MQFFSTTSYIYIRKELQLQLHVSMHWWSKMIVLVSLNQVLLVLRIIFPWQMYLLIGTLDLQFAVLTCKTNNLISKTRSLINLTRYPKSRTTWEWHAILWDDVSLGMTTQLHVQQGPRNAVIVIPPFRSRVSERWRYKRFGFILEVVYGHDADTSSSTWVSRPSLSQGEELFWESLTEWEWKPWITLKSKKETTPAFLYEGYSDGMISKTQSAPVRHVPRTRPAFRLLGGLP